jgi:hypothetical protein
MSRNAHLLAVLALLAGCGDDSPVGPDVPRPDPVLGLAAFSLSCAGCHAAADGFDLAFFGFRDTTIIRRAVAHVDTATAKNIVAYIRTLATPHAPENARLFQPGGAPLASDVEFATSLFGQDGWPEGLTTAELRAIDPRMVRVALPLPVWSDEGTNLDWMPDAPLPEGMLAFDGGNVAASIAGYRAFPSRENLGRAVRALRMAERTPGNAEAPCLLEDPARVNYVVCFEVRRWTSTLVAQHMLRYGMAESLGPEIHDIWWDVGNAARKSRADPSGTIPRPLENWASWMYLGWSFDPSRHPSVYTGGGLRQLALSRHATFIALRSQVARPRGSLSVYDDLVQAVRFSPNPWTAPAAGFGFRHLLERLSAGDRPGTSAQVSEAALKVNMALGDASRKVGETARVALAALAKQVLAALNEK